MADSLSITITLPDGSTRQLPHGSTVQALAQSIGKRLGRDAIAAVLDSEPALVDVHTPLRQDCAVRIITVGSEAGLEVVRHSTAHLMAAVVQRLFPGTQVTIGPATETGFFYDFKYDGGFTPDDLVRVEAAMHALAAEKLVYVREEVSRAAAERLFADLGETYKLEILAGIPADETISLYRLGDWVDLCRGPHVPSTAALGAFRLTHVGGAHWRGDEQQPMLARIYGTAFWTQKALDAHFEQLEEAKKRDHRRVGRELDLFSFHPWAPAMPFFHPRGARIYNGLTEFIRTYYQLLGFDEVITPQVFDTELFKQSGHYDNYRDSMFFCHIDDREFGIKPMNCPGHTLIYAAAKRSFRDLPIRYADFGRLHRFERSGVTAGLTRVRSFAQDDAHIFCQESQVAREIELQILMIEDIYRHFGFETQIGLSTRPVKSLGREADLGPAERAEWDGLWQRAESMLRQAIDAAALPYTENAGDGAFYGPKIDCQVKDAIGRWHQLGTIQLDFGLPKRFDLSFTDSGNQEARPVMVHRAVLGSLERFMGILLEHTGGDLPMWLAPEQVRIITLNDELRPYGLKVRHALRAAGLRAELDGRSEKLGYKVREAELTKVPVVVVVGAREAAAGQIAVRLRKKGDMGARPLDQAVADMVIAAAVPLPGERLLHRVEELSGGI